MACTPCRPIVAHPLVPGGRSTSAPHPPPNRTPGQMSPLRGHLALHSARKPPEKAAGHASSAARPRYRHPPVTTDEPQPTPRPGVERPDGRQIAVFDFDGTLARRDTLLQFLVEATSARRVATALAAQTPSVLRDRRDRDGAKERVIRRLLAGEDPERLAELGRNYAVGLVHLLRPEMAERVRWHRGEGHELIIVSASLRYYLTPFAENLGFDHVIAVDLEVGSDGRLTGRLAGPNVRGPEKAVRLRSWLGDEEPAESWAYGDSSGDVELLEMVDHPTWVGRGAKRNRGTVTP